MKYQTKCVQICMPYFKLEIPIPFKLMLIHVRSKISRFCTACIPHIFLVH